MTMVSLPLSAQAVNPDVFLDFSLSNLAFLVDLACSTCHIYPESASFSSSVFLAWSHSPSSFTGLSQVQVSPAFRKVRVLPLCFWENIYSLKEISRGFFAFMEKNRKAKIVFSSQWVTEAHPKLENGTAKLLPWELSYTQHLSIKAPELFTVGISICALSQFIFSIISKMCPKVIAFFPSIISAQKKFYRITLAYR